MHIPKIIPNLIHSPANAIKEVFERAQTRIKPSAKEQEDFYVSNAGFKAQRNILANELRGVQSDTLQSQSFEEVIRNNLNIISSFGKNGLPLTYKRENFIANLENIFFNLNAKEKEEILQKLGIELSYPFCSFNSAKKASGYDGILHPERLNLRNFTERRVYDECNKFLYKNRVKTGNEELDNALNNLIKGAPEFINIIGKKQNTGHSFTTDIHSLNVLGNLSGNPKYETLTEDDKFILKMTALFHDIGKKESARDLGHPYVSYQLVSSFIDDFELSPDIKTRILKNIKNHQWLQLYNNYEASKNVIDDLVKDYVTPSDYTIALIMTSADLAATSSLVSDAFSYLLDDNPQKPLREAVKTKFNTRL